MSRAPAARDDLFVVGIGHPLMGDDRVGIALYRRLERYFEGFHGAALYEMDIGIAETLSRYDRLLVIDATLPSAPQTAEGEPPPFTLEPLPPAEATAFPGGYLTHIFDWGFLLGITRALYGRVPEATLLAVATERCALSEKLSDRCVRNAEEAFAFLKRYCCSKASWCP